MNDKKKSMKCGEFIWVQRDGTPIHVREMDDNHLLCTIRMMRRNATLRADEDACSQSAGIWDAEDAAGLYFIEANDLLHAHPTWAALQFERRMRGLEELPVISAPVLS